MEDDITLMLFLFVEVPVVIVAEQLVRPMVPQSGSTTWIQVVAVASSSSCCCCSSRSWCESSSSCSSILLHGLAAKSRMGHPQYNEARCINSVTVKVSAEISCNDGNRFQ